MDKRVVLNGIEILSLKEDTSAKSLFDFIEEVIDLLEKNLDKNDENFSLVIHTEFFLNRKPKYTISFNGLKNFKTRSKVVKIIKGTTRLITSHATGTTSVNLLIIDI